MAILLTVTISRSSARLRTAIYGGIGLGTFYFSGIALGDWTSPTNDGLWRDGSKTLFDPCPTGWRVPRSGAGTASPWSAFGTDPYAAPFFFYINGIKQTAPGIPVFVVHPNNGRLCENGGTKAWYPAGGIRNIVGGELAAVGSEGSLWAGSANGSMGVELLFNASRLNPSHTGHRSYGFQVRCVRE